MNGKKTLPLLVIATLMLSLLPSIMFANAAATITGPAPGLTYVKGDTIKVTGTGVVAGTTVQLYWDDATIAWNGVKGLVNSTTGQASGAFEVWMVVPEATSGNHYLWVKDSTGSAISLLAVVGPVVKLSPTTGLPGDTITVTGYGYFASEKFFLDNGTVRLSTPTSNSLGTVTTTFKVPSGALPQVATINLYNNTAPSIITASAAFTVGPVITITPTIGSVGTVVSIVGRGFTPSTVIAAGAVTLGGTVCKILTTNPSSDPLGRIRIDVVVPDKAKGTYPLVITAAPSTATADFEINAVASIAVSPSYGPVSSSMVLTGTNFPKVSGVEVAITFNAAPIGTATTAADGTFSKSFIVPAAVEGTYAIVATATGYNILPATNFKVGTMNIIMGSTSGPTGKTVTISGNGFTGLNTWNATFGSETVVTGAVVAANGLLTGGTFQVPQLPVGTYTITVWDEASDISLTAQFQITLTTEVVLSQTSVPNGFNVTLRGKGFSDAALGLVNFVIYNTTSTGAIDFWWTMNVYDIPSGAQSASNATGEFYGWWKVNPSTLLGLGAYTINATDADGYMVSVPFTVSETHIVAATRKPSFAAGETLSFTLEHSFGGTATLPWSQMKIWNPSGALVFTSDQWANASWVKTGVYYTLPYSAQTVSGNPMTLLDDAPVGTWSWTWYDNAGDVIKSGEFTVTQTPAGTVDEQIQALAAQITAITTTVNNLSTTVASVATTATAASNAATAASTAATNAATAATAASAAATAAGTNAQAAKTAADNAAAAANGLTTLVYAAIGASLVAALAAIVALMQISRKIA